MRAGKPRMETWKAASVLSALGLLLSLMGPTGHPASDAKLTSFGESGSDAPIDSPIQHVVIINQENHSFDNVLGNFCDLATQGQIQRDPCEGATTGVLPDGTVTPLQQAADLVPIIRHSVKAQEVSIAHGQMNGFGRLQHCRTTDDPPVVCYSQFTAREQIPNTWDLATTFAVSDHTFELRASPSWGGHIILAAATLDGFRGDKPRSFNGKGPGVGCDSLKDALWGPEMTWVPSCVPDAQGNGPYRSSPVQYVPTIFKELDDAQLPWKIYGGAGFGGKDGYQWTICPTFFECLDTQASHFVPAQDVLTDAQNGTLPSFSIITPTGKNSQHNGDSMLAGDNWIGQVVGQIMNGPQWSSTAIFLTWDDCGCFYDHLNPLTYDPDWGIRVPMIIISPYAKPGYTDATPATFASLLAFTEHLFGLPALTQDDATAYDYSAAFSFSQQPLRPIPMTSSKVPEWEVAWIQAHPEVNDDGT